MSLEATLERLRAELARLQDAVSALQVTVSQDKPKHDEVVLADLLDDMATDLLGMLDEATESVAQRLADSQPDGQLKKTRRTLYLVQKLTIEFMFKYFSELAAHENISRLLAMGQERGRAWQHWVKAVNMAVERCAAPLRGVENAVLECWNELGEQLARNSVSVQATNIGQQITLREDQLALAVKPG